MPSIQLALTDSGKAEALKALLLRSTHFSVECTSNPDFRDACVVVVDPTMLVRLGHPLRKPDRVVLIAPNDPSHFQNAWDAGVHSVVSSDDPLNTVVLAILSICLQAGGKKPDEVNGQRANQTKEPFA